jgi:hypothetical protein
VDLNVDRRRPWRPTLSGTVAAIALGSMLLGVAVPYVDRDAPEMLPTTLYVVSIVTAGVFIVAYFAGMGTKNPYQR